VNRASVLGGRLKETLMPVCYGITAMAKLKHNAQPLRNPGQSIDEEIERVIHDDFMTFFVLALVLWAIAFFEWLGKQAHWPRIPGIYALTAIAASAFCVIQYIRTKRRVKNLKKGRDGERDVAEILDELKREGANVLHDLPGEGGNVDHVVICSRGIFVVETKNWSKPERVWQMDYDGERIHIEGRAPNGAPIVQCKAEVGDIKTLLKESTSKIFPVRGVVLFIDWYVKRTSAARGSEVWVVNPKELAGWIRNEREVLSADDVAMATLHLKQFVKRLAA
jgi:hypothetical protein